MGKLWIILIVCLVGSLSACANKQITVHTVNDYVVCPKPTEPTYNKIENLDDEENINLLIDNISMMSIYVNQLESTIRCYETQTED